MNSQEQIKQAIQQQALRLREEFPDLEEIRPWVSPNFDQAAQRAEIVFQGPGGTGRFWWEEQEQIWKISDPDEFITLAQAGKLREMLRRVFQDMQERLVAKEMQQQILYLRDEFGGVEEIESWARTIYNYEEKHPEVRFDTSAGLCRFWRTKTQWDVRLPDGSLTHAPIGGLRDYIVQVRKFLRKGVL